MIIFRAQAHETKLSSLTVNNAVGMEIIQRLMWMFVWAAWSGVAGLRRSL